MHMWKEANIVERLDLARGETVHLPPVSSLKWARSEVVGGKMLRGRSAKCTLCALYRVVPSAYSCRIRIGIGVSSIIRGRTITQVRS